MMFLWLAWVLRFSSWLILVLGIFSLVLVSFGACDLSFGFLKRKRASLFT
jgi:hypothetical protein